MYFNGIISIYVRINSAVNPHVSIKIYLSSSIEYNDIGQSVLRHIFQAIGIKKIRWKLF